MEFDLLVKEVPGQEAGPALQRVRGELEEFGAEIIESGPDRLTAKFFGKSLLLQVTEGGLAGVYGKLSLDEAGRQFQAFLGSGDEEN